MSPEGLRERVPSTKAGGALFAAPPAVKQPASGGNGKRSNATANPRTAERSGRHNAATRRARSFRKRCAHALRETENSRESRQNVQTTDTETLLLEMPQWMFKSGACCLVLSAEKPAVNCAAFVRAKVVPDFGIRSLREGLYDC